MSSVFTITLFIVIIVVAAFVISISIAGTVFLLKETGILDIFREIVKKDRK